MDTAINFGGADGFYQAPPNQGQQQQGYDSNAYSNDFGGNAGFQSNPSAFAPPPVSQPMIPNTDMSGSMGGSMGTGGGFGGGSGTSFGQEEPPLLEELGINFEHIQAKTLSVLHPFSTSDAQIMAETDLAGPLVFCLMFGATLLATGRVQFGYIYGVAMVGCIGLYSVLNLMSTKDMTLGLTASVLGYCLLPMVGLSATGILLNLQGTIGAVLSAAAVLWCASAASKMFCSGLDMHDQRLLVAYPCFLLYGVFAIITVF